VGRAYDSLFHSIANSQNLIEIVIWQNLKTYDLAVSAQEENKSTKENQEAFPRKLIASKSDGNIEEN